MSIEERMDRLIPYFYLAVLVMSLLFISCVTGLFIYERIVFIMGCQ